MRVLIAVLFCGMVGSVLSVPGQTKSVTNADLEAFRQKRLQAEREYRENYSRLGMPSPEELEKRRVEDIKKLEELSEKLRSERLEREARDAERRNRLRRQLQLDELLMSLPDAERPSPYYGGFYTSGFSGFRQRRFFGRGHKNFLWRAGGGGVIYEPGGRSSFVWPAPIFRRPPHIRGPR